MTVTESAARRLPDGWLAPPGPVDIRRAQPAELPAIGEMLERAYAASYTLESAYRDELRHLERFAPEAEVWAAFVDGTPAGALVVPAPGRPAHYVVDPPEPEIGFRMLGVDPAFRGRSIARVLIEFVAALGRERGARRIGIYSAEHMLQAHGLYRRLGFVREPWRDATVPHAEPIRLFAFVWPIDSPTATGARREHIA